MFYYLYNYLNALGNQAKNCELSDVHFQYLFVWMLSKKKKKLNFMKVGFYVKPEKWIKMNVPHFVETAKKHGINIISINLNNSLEEQGPFDIIIHKSIDLFVQSNYFHNEKAKLQLQNFQKYINSHPDVPIINPLSFDELVTSRSKIFNELNKLQFNKDCYIPDLSIHTNKYVIKPDLACGSIIAHQFKYIDNNDIMFQSENSKNQLIQPYFDTGDSVLKVYVIANHTKVHVKKPDLFKLDYDMESLNRISNILRNAFKCDLFGFDLIQDIKSKKWYIIDLNSFSGIEIFSDYEEMVIELIHQKTGK